MSDSTGKPWSNNPYAPQITSGEYFAEKANFAGFLIGAILYGIVIVLFFQCMGALLNSTNRTREGIKWGMVAHTMAMFSFVTIFTAINLHIQSISYIDNREFPGTDSAPWPTPLGYQFFIATKAISIVPSITFTLNTWLADGLLLYRCYVTYAMNHWVIAFPCLMYLASMAMGIAFTYESSQPANLPSSPVYVAIAEYGTAYYSISLSLNTILTLMIVTRLVLHRRNIRNAMGAPAGAGGLYKTVITMLVESCALYAVSYLLFIGSWARSSSVSNIFFPILAETQAIAPFLIILRVANQRALTSDTIAPGSVSSIRFGSPGKSKGGNGTLPGGYSTSSVDASGKPPGELGVGPEVTIDFHHDKV